MVVYRSVENQTCMAAAPMGRRTKQIGCGGPYVTAEELLALPITTVNAVRVPSDARGSTIVISGLADPQVDRIRVPNRNDHAWSSILDSPSLRIPFPLDVTLRSSRGPPRSAVEIKPFLIAVRDPGTSTISILAHTLDGRRYRYRARVNRPWQ
jgi:hypothetical protein